MDITYDILYVLDTIISIILKVVGLIALHMWIIVLKGDIR